MNRRLVPVAGSPFLAQRLVVFFGSTWLLISWVLVIGLKRPLLPSPETWLPGVRLMLVMAAIGLIVVWPMAAMATTRPLSTQRTLRETSILLLTAQLIAWPAGLVTTWTMPRTVLIAMTLTGWGFLAGALAAWGRCRTRPGRRVAMMACCLLMAMVAPVVLWFDDSASWMEGFSPLSSLWTMASAGNDSPIAQEWIITTAVWVLAMICWFLFTALAGCEVREQTGTSPK